MKILKAKINDAEAISQIHRKMISGGFLSGLGGKFLLKLYEKIIRSDNNFCFIVKDNKEMVAFACATKNTKALYRDFLKSNFFLAIMITIKKIFSLSSLKKILDHLIYNSKKIGLPEAELLSIAVINKHKRKKLGTKLCKKINEEFLNFGIREYIIITASDNFESNSFFKNVGYKKIKNIRIHKDRKSSIYSIKMK